MRALSESRSSPPRRARTRPAPQWMPGPARPRLGRGEAHVWLADLDALGEGLDQPLTEDELDRAARMRSERDRRRWTAAHAMLRTLLGRYLARDPLTIELSLGVHGKPRLADERADAPGRALAARSGDRTPAPTLRFNLSHSGNLALCAFNLAGEIGVDIELAGRSRDEIALAARTFGDEEARRLARLEPADRTRAFLALWARYEAAAKCEGTGIGRADGAPPVADGPWIVELDVGERGAAAVALERPPQTLRCLLWAPAPAGDAQAGR